MKPKGYIKPPQGAKIRTPKGNYKCFVWQNSIDLYNYLDGSWIMGVTFEQYEKMFKNGKIEIYD